MDPPLNSRPRSELSPAFLRERETGDPWDKDSDHSQLLRVVEILGAALRLGLDHFV